MAHDRDSAVLDSDSFHHVRDDLPPLLAIRWRSVQCICDSGQVVRVSCYERWSLG